MGGKSPECLQPWAPVVSITKEPPFLHSSESQCTLFPRKSWQAPESGLKQPRLQWKQEAGSQAGGGAVSQSCSSFCCMFMVQPHFEMGCGKDSGEQSHRGGCKYNVGYSQKRFGLGAALDLQCKGFVWSSISGGIEAIDKYGVCQPLCHPPICQRRRHG